MNREGIVVARCTVEQLMRRLGLRGVIRGKVVRTTVSDAKAACPPGASTGNLGLIVPTGSKFGTSPMSRPGIAGRLD